MASMEKGESQELNLILKGDVSGSVEALEDALAKIDVGDEVSLRVIDRGVGAITETNVDLAAASDAIIIGFNVRPQGKATELADREGVEIRYYSVIYQAIEEIEAALKGMLKPEFEESTLGQAEIRAIFRSSKIGNIAGCMVTSGVIRRNAKVRLIRDGAVVADNLDLASLQAGEGRRVRGPRGLRVRSRAAELPGHQGGRRRRGLRDEGDPAGLSRSVSGLVHSSNRRRSSVSRRHVRLHRSTRPRERRAMANPRVRKIADRIQVIVAEMLERRIKDPRLGFVTVTDVRVTGDTPAGDGVLHRPRRGDATSSSTAAALESAKGLIRSEVGKQLGMRHAPTLTFVPTRCPRPPGTSTRCSRGPRRSTRRPRRAAGRRTPASADPYKKPHEDDDDDEADDGAEGDRRVRAGRRRQARRDDLARRRRPRTPAGRHPQGRPRRHARPDGHRRPGARPQPGDPAARSPHAHRQESTTPRSGSARPPPPTTPRARSLETAADGRPRPRTPCGRRSAAFVGEIEQVPSAVSAIKVDGCAPMRGCARARRSSCRPAGSPSTRSTCSTCARLRRTVDVDSRCAARAAPTSAPSPATSAPRSAWAAT